MYVVTALFIYSTLSVNLITQAQSVKVDRSLASAELLEEKLLHAGHSMSIDIVREQITDLHKNVKLCMDLEFAKDPKDIMPFESIIEMCAGSNFSIVLRFYNDVTFTVKEVLKERIKVALKRGYCDDIVFMCITYFKMIDLFINLDYDILKSLEVSKNELSYDINRDRLEYMIQETRNQIGDYIALRESLSYERNFLSSYFADMKAKYGAKFADYDLSSLTNGAEENIGEDHDSPIENEMSEVASLINGGDSSNNSQVTSLLDAENHTSHDELLDYLYKV